MRFSLILLILLVPISVWSQEDDAIRVLDFDRRDSGSFRWELTPNGGEYFGDKLNHSFVVGQSVQMNLIPSLAVVTDFGYSNASIDRTSALAATITDTHLYILSAGLVATKPAAYQVKEKVVEADFYTSLGGGVIRFNRDARGMGYIGGGMKTYFRKIPWLGWRVEVKGYLFSIPNPAASDFVADLTVTGGLTFLLDSLD